MNSQFTPGLAENFGKQEHERLLKVAAEARLARLAAKKVERPSIRSFFLGLAGRARPKKVEEGSPSVAAPVTMAAIISVAAIQIAFLVAI